MHKISRVYLYLIILIVYLLEITVLYRIRFAGVQPDLLLVLVIYFSLSLSLRQALEVGIVVGVLRDLLSSWPFGINTILLGTIAFLMSLYKDKIYKDFFLAQILLTIVAAMFLYLGHFFLRFVTGGTELMRFPESLIWVIIPTVLYTAVITPLTFPLLGFIHRFVKRRTAY